MLLNDHFSSRTGGITVVFIFKLDFATGKGTPVSFSTSVFKIAPYFTSSCRSASKAQNCATCTLMLRTCPAGIGYSRIYSEHCGLPHLGVFRQSTIKIVAGTEGRRRIKESSRQVTELSILGKVPDRSVWLPPRYAVWSNSSAQ